MHINAIEVWKYQLRKQSNQQYLKGFFKCQKEKASVSGLTDYNTEYCITKLRTLLCVYLFFYRLCSRREAFSDLCHAATGGWWP